MHPHKEPYKKLFKNQEKEDNFIQLYNHPPRDW